MQDLTPLVDLVGERGAGPVRARRPVYVDLLPPCNRSCPAGENIQAWLALAQAGRYRDAWRELVKENPLPAVHGRVCYHPCETSCNRNELDSAVGIHAVERFLGDLAAIEGWQFAVAQTNGKRVLVIGGGPCGLSAAYHLARMGHEVEIHDAGSSPGGMLRYGIPAYRLPREDLTSEIARIEQAGVTIVCDRVVHDVLAEKEQGRFDAVLVAIGTQIDKRIDIPTSDASRVLTALSLLRGVGEHAVPKLGRRVVVYGGGDTAMDAARSVRRLGADEPLIVYHRDRSHMRAHEYDLREALGEGVKVKWLREICSIGLNDIVVEEVALDERGIPQPTGRTERLEADAVILALGEATDAAFLRSVPGLSFNADGSLVVDANLMTGVEGIFAGGDATAGEHSVTVAVGQGKKAARGIDAWLRGETAAELATQPVVTFDMLHLPIYSDAVPKTERELPIPERLAGFPEVVAGLTQTEARYEAQRCLSCGNCFECDMCYAACPEQAIVKLGPGDRYRIDVERCTGCGICFEQCPSHAIEMIAEPARG